MQSLYYPNPASYGPLMSQINRHLHRLVILPDKSSHGTTFFCCFDLVVTIIQNRQGLERPACRPTDMISTLLSKTSNIHPRR